MKRHASLLAGGLLTAGLAMVAPHALAANEFTETVKEGYHDLKQNVKGMVNDITGDDRKDAQKYMEQRKEDMKDYREKVLEARKDYMQSRQEAQADYLKNHKQLPIQEDLNKDMDLSGRVQNAGMVQ